MTKANCMLCGSLAFLALLWAGCKSNQYEITLQPDGPVMQRELICWTIQSSGKGNTVSPIRAAELQRIAQAYHTDVPAGDENKRRFVGAFANQMPQDVGGNGWYSRCETSLGILSAYVERFRGNDDLTAEIEARQQATDRVADLLIGWFQSELGDETGFDSLRRFLDHQFRRDLQNLALYVWAWEITSQDEKEIQLECLVRAGQYLVERSYLRFEELPELVRAWREADQSQSRLLFVRLQKFLASKMDLSADQPIPACLQFLADAETAERSLDAYLGQTKEHQELVEQWKQKRESDPRAEEPRRDTILSEPLARAFLPNLLGGSDQVDVTLATAVEPFLTNGDWNEESALVRWSRSVLASDTDRSEFPALAYAFWSAAAEDEQRARFGKVILTGTNLGSYCLWYRSLSQDEAKVWDTFLASLHAGPDVPDRLRTFRFPQDQGKEDDDLAEVPRDLILVQLEGEQP